MLSQDLYKKSSAISGEHIVKSSTAGSRAGGRNLPATKRSMQLNPQVMASVVEDVTEGGHTATPDDYFSEESMMSRMKLYASKSGVPQDYIDRYLSEMAPKNESG